MKTITIFSAVFFSMLLGLIFPVYGQWQKFVIEDDISRAVSVDVADLNYDGKNDILVTNYDNSEIALYLNNYPSWTKDVIATGRFTFAFFGDMDNNDTLDIVASNFGAKRLYWYENNHPTWTEHLIDAITDDADHIQVADINGDDTLDVVTGGYSVGNDIVWYENNHSGWVEHIIEDDASNAPILDVNDIDGDGIQDILVSLKSDKKIVWYKTEDKGLTWTKNIVDENLSNAWCIFSADMDADNDMDVVATNGGPYGGGGKDVVWYENINLEWTMHTIDSTLEGANIVEVADVDGDGTPDVIATGFSADDVVWYKTEDKGLTWTKHIIDDGSVKNFV